MKLAEKIPSTFPKPTSSAPMHYRPQGFVDVKGEMDSWTRAAEGSGQVLGKETEVGDVERRSIAEGLLIPFFTFLRHTSLCSPSPNLKE